MVVTGACSGIGRATARLAASQGARVVLTSRDDDSLEQAVQEIRREGGEAISVTGDVAEMSDVQRVGEAALERYGRIDTWVNNAGVTIYGRIAEVSLEDARRLFDVNYWGVVHGSLVAMDAMRSRGGVIVNVGSILSERAIPLQGHYSASKHAVKGFTDALRVEIERSEIPISISLVKPGSTATQYTEHARNYMHEEPDLPPPLYAPEVVARTILECAQHRVRDVVVGGSGRMITAMANMAPRLTDRIMRSMFKSQRRDGQPRRNGDSNLHAPMIGTGREEGSFDHHVMRSSLYTRAALHPGWTLMGIAALGVGAMLVARARA